MGPPRRVAPKSRRIDRLIVVSVSPVTKADGQGISGGQRERSQGSAPDLARSTRVPYTGIAAHCGVDRKRARQYVEAAQAAGLQRNDGAWALDDGLIGAVIETVRPERPNGHGPAWDG